MIIWLASYPRSGNSMLRMLVHQVFGSPTANKHACGNGENNTRRKETEILEAFGNQYHSTPWPETYRNLAGAREVHFVKTHDAPEDDGKAIYIVRNGFASILSYQAFTRDFAKTERSLEEMVLGLAHFDSWGRHLDLWNPIDRPNTLLIKYEDLRDEPENQIERIAQFCGLPAQGRWTNEFEKFHALQPNFFRKGQTKDVSSEFSQRCQELFWALHGDWMRRLGYCQEVPKISSGYAELRRLIVEKITHPEAEFSPRKIQKTASANQ